MRLTFCCLSQGLTAGLPNLTDLPLSLFTANLKVSQIKQLPSFLEKAHNEVARYIARHPLYIIYYAIQNNVGNTGCT